MGTETHEIPADKTRRRNTITLQVFVAIAAAIVLGILDPQLALAQENLALLHYAQQERTEALASLSAAIALDSKNAFTRYLRANLSFSGGGAAARAISSLKMTCSINEAPRPPNSAGQEMPAHPPA